MVMSVRALVILSAVVASAVARPGSLASVADPASSKVPTARTSSNQEAGADDKSLAEVAKSLQNPAADSLDTSRPDNPAGIRFVDNPHIGLPFGAVLPVSDPVAPARATPTASSVDTLDTIRRDSPHVGLPPIIPTLDSPANTASASSPMNVYQTGTSSYGASGNSNIHTEVLSKGNDASDLSMNTSPDSVNVDRDPGLPKTDFANCANPDFLKRLFPNSLPTPDTHVSFPASSPMPHFTSNAGLHGRSGAASLLTTNGNSDSPTKNPPSHIPVNTAPYGFLDISPKSFPLTNTAFTLNHPEYLYLFSEDYPNGNVLNTAKGPVIFGGPVNLAVFPKQPTRDDINQMLTAHELVTGRGPGGHAFGPPADTTA